jgi:hypothetical protein
MTAMIFGVKIREIIMIGPFHQFRIFCGAYAPVIRAFLAFAVLRFLVSVAWGLPPLFPGRAPLR